MVEDRNLGQGIQGEAVSVASKKEFDSEDLRLPVKSRGASRTLEGDDEDGEADQDGAV